jgi:branched-subunit amino acid aminotransferase/4-amino-4-deoxychorismate lyase
MLAGVAQALVQRGLADAGLTGRMEPLRVADLERFDAAFLCNSATPACAIATIGERMFAMRPGLIERLQGAWASNPLQPI